MLKSVRILNEIFILWFANQQHLGDLLLRFWHLNLKKKNNCYSLSSFCISFQKSAPYLSSICIIQIIDSLFFLHFLFKNFLVSDEFDYLNLEKIDWLVDASILVSNAFRTDICALAKKICNDNAFSLYSYKFLMSNAISLIMQKK